MKLRISFIFSIGLVVLAGRQTFAQTTYVFSIFAGKAGVSGANDGAAASARFNYPQGLAMDASNNLYVADSDNGTVRVITSGGQVATVVTTSAGAPFSFKAPQGIAVDANFSLYVTDNNYLYRIDNPGGQIAALTGAGGTVTNLAGSTAGSSDGIGTNAQFNQPYGVTLDSAGTIFVADENNNAIRRVTTDNEVTTLFEFPTALDSEPVAASPPAPPVTSFDERIPSAVVVDANDSLFFAANNFTSLGLTNGFIGEITESNGVSIVWSGSDPIADAIALDPSGNIYLVDTISNLLIRLDPDGEPQVLGVLPLKGTIGGMAIDSSGSVYLADSLNHVIIKWGVKPPSFFDGAVSAGGNSFYLACADGAPFGYYNGGDYQFPLFAHVDMGFEYFFDPQDGNAFFYDFTSSSFWYTGTKLFPYIYDFTLGSWLYYYPNPKENGHYTSGPRMFYNFSTSEIISR
jgi:sugar lactone lactonase YvrE